MAESGRPVTTENTEAKLLGEIEDLKRRLRDQQRKLESTPAAAHHRRKPSSAILVTIGLVLAVLVVVAFFVGYIPGKERRNSLLNDSKEQGEALASVNVAKVAISPGKSQLVLPGNIQALTEAPVLARASGYLKSRSVDMGDRVKSGQILAEIDALEIGQQVEQAQATLEQMNASLDQANANLIQGRTNEKLAKTTNDRYQSLVKRGAVSRQESDTYQAQFDAQQASTQSLEKAVNVARSNVHVAEANLGRLKDMQGYLQVRAPFDGVVTLRNVEVGALVTEGSTLLFRVAQTGRLRIYLNVPQADSTEVHVGQKSILSIPDLPNRKFDGTVTRTANALDPTSRTLLTEIQVANPNGVLLPGMYAEVDLTVPRKDPPLLIPGDTLVVRADGPQVAIVRADKSVHFQKIALGRDYGEKVEVLSGLEVGQLVIVNPGDRVTEGAKVNPIPVVEKGKKT